MKSDLFQDIVIFEGGGIPLMQKSTSNGKIRTKCKSIISLQITFFRGNNSNVRILFTENS